MEKLFETLLTTMDENSFMVEHEKKKVKEISKTIKQLIKVNENIENKVDIAPFMIDREQHIKQYSEYKEQQRKLNKIFRILNKDTEE